jgi:hypothetical protein
MKIEYPKYNVWTNQRRYLGNDTDNLIRFQNSFKIVDISKPIIFRFSPDVPYAELNERFVMWSSDDEVCIICDDKKTYGYHDFFDEFLTEDKFLESDTVLDHIDLITPDISIDSSHNLVDLDSLLPSTTRFFVLTGDQVTHTFSIADLNNPIMSLFLFTYISKIEQELFFLLSSYRKDFSLEQAFSKLSPKRLKMINDEMEKSESGLASHKQINLSNGELTDENDTTQPIYKPDYRKQLKYTNIVDKSKILQGIPGVVAQLPFATRDEYGAFFYNVKYLRNRIAHNNVLVKCDVDVELLLDVFPKMKKVQESLIRINREEFPYTDEFGEQ